MSESPVPRDPGQDGNLPGTPPGPGDHPSLGSPGWQLIPQTPDWDEACLAAAAHDEDPGDPEDYEYEDPDNAPPPGLDDYELAALIAAADEVTADYALAEAIRSALGQTAAVAAVGALATGRRGPGMPGSAETYPGGQPSPAAGFGSGQPLDVARGCPTLGSFLEDAAGSDDRYAGASDDELAGVICAQDRVEAHACAVKHAAVAELIRRRPAPDAPVRGPAQLPEGWNEFTGRELGAILGISAGDAAEMLDLAWHLEGRLPGTRALFRTGVLSRDKAAAIAWATAFLTPAEARRAEALVLGRAAQLTWAGLRAAIRAAVMDVNPGAARKRRAHGAKRTRVERWAEDSGNAGLAGRELPPAEVLAADQRVTAWAQQLRNAGLEGSMDQLRARAYLDLLLGTDSRPHGTSPDTTHSQDTGTRDPDGTDTDTPGPDTPPGPDTDSGPEDGAGPDGPGGPGPSDPPGPRTPAPAGPLTGVIPPGFAARVNLTIPAVTVLNLAHRPGEMTGIGPIDPDLARDLAAAAARNPRSTWCITVTDSHGHAIGHGCARPAPANSRSKRVTPDSRGSPGARGGPDPPDQAPFTVTPDSQPGPPGGYRRWRFSTGIPGQPDLLIDIGPLPTGPCDHRHQARGHDPGVMLRHLTQIRHAACTGPGCRRPAATCDFEHNIPYEAGGRTCLCNGNPKCRFDHRIKQDPRWKVEQLPSGEVRWTMPSGRQYVTEPTRYPI